MDEDKKREQEETTHKEPPVQTSGAPLGPSRNILQRFFAKVSTLIKNLICLLIWAWFFCRIFGVTYPLSHTFGGIAIWIAELWRHQPLRLGTEIAVAAIVLIIIFYKKRAAGKILLFFLFRLFFFPLVLAFWIPYLPYRVVKPVYSGINIVLSQFLRTGITKAAVLLALLVPASIFIVSNSEDSAWLIASLVLLGLGLIITLRVAFLWTAKPLIIIEEVLVTYFRILDFFVRTGTKIESKSKNPKRDAENTEKLLESLTKSLSWSENFIEKNTDQRIVVKFFLVLFAVCFVLTVLIFAVIYYNLTRIQPLAFANSHDWLFLDYVYSSLLVITTSGNISPVWAVAKAAVCLEILSGICLLSLLVFQFTMISIPEVMEKRGAILKLLDGKRREILNTGENYRNKVLGPEGTLDITAEPG